MLATIGQSDVRAGNRAPLQTHWRRADHARLELAGAFPSPGVRLRAQAYSSSEFASAPPYSGRFLMPSRVRHLE